MPNFLNKLLRMLRERHGKDMRFLCQHLLSERGEASQTALAEEIIKSYNLLKPSQRLAFFEMLSKEFSPDAATVNRAAADFRRKPDAKHLAALSIAVEPPRQELFRRINTAARGTETLVAMREDILRASSNEESLTALDADLKHLLKSWFNRGFLRLERISWQSSAAILEKLIRYESVHEINGWSDLRRRLEADRRCYAFFHPALADDPIIFVEVALSSGISSDLAPLLDIHAPLLAPEKADTAVFYSINNCLYGLRGVPFGSFLIKQVVEDLAAEFPKIKNYATLSPLPQFARALRDQKNEQGFTYSRLSHLIEEFAPKLTSAAGERDPVKSLFLLLKDPVAHRTVLAAPLERLALAYLTKARKNNKPYDPVAVFHLSNGARVERVNAFGNVRPYGLEASFGLTVNYRYLPDDLEENHERFVRDGEIRVSDALHSQEKLIDAAWRISAKMTPAHANK